jgi:hypothetical protein
MKHSRLLSIVPALALALTLAVPALAADAERGDAVLTRGEFVLALYQLAEAWDGEATQNSFDDVPAEGELAPAVSWASANGIVYGYGNRVFGPDDPVTREQMAAMLYRNAKLYGQGFEGAWYFPLDYPDAAAVSDWADEAMHWVVMNEIIVGTDKGLEPDAPATDDQLALVLARWQETVGASDAETVVDDPYLGAFADEDGNKALEIGLTEYATHSVKLSIIRLASFDDGEGNMSDGGLSFMATDPNGNPIHGMINLDAEDPEQNTLIVVITDSTWELLPDGTAFRFTRIIPKHEQTGTAGSNIPLKDNLVEAEAQVLAAVERYLRDAWGGKIDDLAVTVDRIYTAEDEAAIEVLRDMALGPNEVAFSVNYKLHPADGVEDLLQFTAATGEIDAASGWIVNKSNIGILRPDPDGEGYIVTDFGTGF